MRGSKMFLPPVLQIALDADRRYLASVGVNPASITDAQIIEAEVAWLEEAQRGLLPYLYNPLAGLLYLQLGAGIALARMPRG